ncbi:MAG: hypothetical protein DDT37_01509 [Firmicutes bacterium]|nr:hypothetical protein [candidate division NPL-UPA2 bacterium]
MSVFSKVRRLFRRRPSIRGTYDAAKIGGQNVQHWLASDALDADTANSLGVRQRISRRSRYEISNNGQGRGIQLTQANYVIGRGPKLRMQTGSSPFNSMIEWVWTRWTSEVKLARKLRTAIKAKVSDGEAFLIIVQNPRLKHPVKLGLQSVECEQVTTPHLGPLEPNKIDGVEFDEFGNPLFYHVLRYHPGSSWGGLDSTPERIPAEFVLHLFREDRPGQHRGVSELHPSLNLFAQARRYREATISAAENIANFSLCLRTQQTPSEGPDLVRPFSTMPIEKSMMVALPYGFDAFQPKAEQPSATYDQFIRSIACEQARPLNMPYNIAAADSSGYSFSGGKLDHMTYFVSVDVEQAEIEDGILEPLFEVWFREAVQIQGWAVPKTPSPLHSWDWPRKPVIDETKTASARKQDLSSGVVSLRRIYAEDGFDLEEELQAMAADYGVTIDELRARLYEVNLKPAGQVKEPPTDAEDEVEASFRGMPRFREKENGKHETHAHHRL